MVFEKLNEYKNLFLEKETKTLWQVEKGQMQKIKYGTIILREEDPTQTFEERLAEMDKKVESGEITCNIDNPDDCEACGA